jgi:peptidoglycan-associated lipoprotein
MTSSQKRNTGLLLLVLSTALVLSCRKTPAALAPPPPLASAPAPPTPAPAITLRATPTMIDRGQPIALQWETRNAAIVRIEPGVGQVDLNGKRQVNPASSVTYQAMAIGPGGTATDIARITVNVPPAPPTATSPPTTRRTDVTTEQLFRQTLQDILFDYDKAEIRSTEVPKLQTGAAWLKQNPNVRFTIEGHCDERGSSEYNIGLGDSRANAVREFLAAQGVAVSRINTVSYGEERPQCRDESEHCLERNRRAAFRMNP